MTWEQWIASNYNTNNWFIGSNKTIQSSTSGGKWLCLDWTNIYSTDTIVESTEYYFGQEID